jgi:hypothetical protein
MTAYASYEDCSASREACGSINSNRLVPVKERVTTRARALINRFNEKTVRCANRYRQAYSALLALDPNGNWKSRLQPLHDDDVKGPGKEDDEAEGTRQLSWIWLVERNGDAASAEEGEVTDSL